MPIILYQFIYASGLFLLIFFFSSPQAICLNFLNTFIDSAPSFNVKVFHQQEIENAGLDPDKIEQVLQSILYQTVLFNRLNISLFEHDIT